MRILFFCLVLLFLYSNGTAQETDSVEVRKPPKKFVTTTDYLKDKALKFVFTIDGRQSFLGSRYVSIDGIKTGMELDGKWRFGLGAYGLVNPLEKYYKLSTSPDTFQLVLHFWYLSVFSEYVLFKNQKWEVSAPLQFGWGQSLGEKKSFKGHLISSKYSAPSLVELSINGHYKIVKWAGIGGGIGYRYMFSKDESLKQYFDSPIIIYKVKLFLGEIYKSLFKSKNKGAPG